jgi:four helix bundle protein
MMMHVSRTVHILPIMQNTKNLIVAERARVLAILVYRATAAFPADERFGLATQMRRAAVSVGSNIAEGCGRRGNRELLNHLYIAFASAKELAFQLQLAEDLDFGAPEDREAVRRELDRVERMLNRFTSFLRSQPAWRRKEGPTRPGGTPSRSTHQPTDQLANYPTHQLTVATRRSAPDAHSP